jgi:hypothetical protein
MNGVILEEQRRVTEVVLRNRGKWETDLGRQVR